MTRTQRQTRPMPRFIVLCGISTTTRTAARTQRQTRPMPVVLDAEIIGRIIDRITEQQETEQPAPWLSWTPEEEEEADRVAALYEDYLIESEM